MLSKARTKYIKSLKLKKIRKQEQLFVVEGAKNIVELLHSDFQLHSLYATQYFLDQHYDLISNLNDEIITATDDQLANAGSLKSNHSALALAKIKQNIALIADPGEYTLVLDDVSDPGNFGTIVRVCDWYGIKKIVASNDSVDLYNPKVIAATMGSFTRVQLFYTDLEKFLGEMDMPVYGAYLDGENIHNLAFAKQGYIVFGNESNGIRNHLAPFIDKKIYIPGTGGAESLNVGIAAAIILDNLHRQV